MEQKDLTKYISPFKRCLVTRAYELCIARKQGDRSLATKTIVFMVQNFLFRAIKDYDVDVLSSLTDDQLREMINSLKKNCPYIDVDALSAVFSGARLPIKIGRWHVGDGSYVSPTT